MFCSFFHLKVCTCGVGVGTNILTMKLPLERRCEHINEYEMTQHSLHAAVSIGLDSGEHAVLEMYKLRRLEFCCSTAVPRACVLFFHKRARGMRGGIRRGCV
jgi:hypothetical protein